jgi:uncharacterized protein (DUF302 family)
MSMGADRMAAGGRRAVWRAVVAGVAILAAGVFAPVAAEPAGLVTRAASHPVRETVQRFAAAVHAEGWIVFGEVDHAAAARAAGLELRARTVVLFGNPKAGTAAMQGRPTLALDLPMRVLVWQDEAGRTMVTRSTGEDIAERVFARHGVTVPPAGRAATEQLLDRLVRQAAE